MVWYGMVWYGMVWNGIPLPPLLAAAKTLAGAEASPQFQAAPPHPPPAPRAAGASVGTLCPPRSAGNCDVQAGGRCSKRMGGEQAGGAASGWAVSRRAVQQAGGR